MKSASIFISDSKIEISIYPDLFEAAIPQKNLQ